VEKLSLRLVLLRQRFISSFLLCAFAIIFAHSIIPHHHHEGRDIGRFAIPDDDHDDTDDSVLGHAFSFFQHDKGNTVVYEASSPTYQAQKVSFYNDVLPFVQHLVRKLYEPPLKHIDNYSFSFPFSSYSESTPFRGPPVLVG
jgi:hypothetical protein